MANILHTLLIIFQLLFVSWSFDIIVKRRRTGDLFSIPDGKCPIGSKENDVTCKCNKDTSTFHVFENKTYGCYKRRDIGPNCRLNIMPQGESVTQLPKNTNNEISINERLHRDDGNPFLDCKIFDNRQVSQQLWINTWQNVSHAYMTFLHDNKINIFMDTEAVELSSGGLYYSVLSCKGIVEGCLLLKVPGSVTVSITPTTFPQTTETTTAATGTTTAITKTTSTAVKTTTSTQETTTTHTTTTARTTTRSSSPTVTTTTFSKATSDAILVSTTTSLTTETTTRNFTVVNANKQTSSSNTVMIAIGAAIALAVLLLVILLVLLKRNRKRDMDNVESSGQSNTGSSVQEYDYARSEELRRPPIGVLKHSGYPKRQSTMGLPPPPLSTDEKLNPLPDNSYASLNFVSRPIESYGTLQRKQKQEALDNKNEPIYFETVPEPIYFEAESAYDEVGGVDSKDNETGDSEPVYVETEPDVYAQVNKTNR
ncbi:uncharacterized protein LOC130649327 [Hydractinia symbiolongicarpus]|uniref:uncharacterized protein LOC130649327 n=1 Tax=Hydractinia symbiolongicarpus TaxID=13093 RepID=UPI00254E4D2A|nr:uncharacterized protein LOC130649327 [Hydractinia symbiolongicarpus]